MIIGKTNIKQDNYDCLVFCVSNTEYIQIPSFIEHICSCHLIIVNTLKILLFHLIQNLKRLVKVHFTLQESCASIFHHQSHQLENNLFLYVNNFEEIIIPNDSKLQTIGKSAFFSSAIKRINITSSVTSIGEYAFSQCEQLEEIIIPIIQNLKLLNVMLFFLQKSSASILPASVTSIEERTFSQCEQLEKIIIPSDSKLETIGKHAFSSSALKSITIPSSVTSIEEGAFLNVICFKLSKSTIEK